MERHHPTQPNGWDNTGVASGPNSVPGEFCSLKRDQCCCAPSRHPLQATDSSRLTPPPIEDVSRGAP
jgi:hypothetical protein